MTDQEVALIIGAGKGLSASLARLCSREGMRVALAARNTAKLDGLLQEASARGYTCDATQEDDVNALFKSVVEDFGVPHLVVYNPSFRTRGPFVELEPAEVEKTIRVTAFGGFLVAQSAARLMLERGGGSIFFTGASASVKGYAQSAPFAMGKFALRGLAQSMARELSPKNIHIGHFVIDGGILSGPESGDDASLHPDAIAETYLNVHRQHRSAWTWEVELRPWVERF